jgi:hypothetical protein
MITKYTNNISSDGTQIRIPISAGKVGSDSGGSFHATPTGLPGARSATLGYSVFIPPEWPYNVKGGKLPGLCVGTSAEKCATGGDWKTDAGSLRFMFRGGKPGYFQCILYVYMPWDGGSAKDKMQKSYDAQGSEYKAAAQPSNGSTGHDLYFDRKNPDKSPFRLKIGEWNDLSMSLILNSSPNASDGSISCTVNGVTKTIQNVRFTNNAAAKISNVNFVSFVGGSDSTWAIKSPLYFLFKNLRFSASA